MKLMKEYIEFAMKNDFKIGYIKPVKVEPYGLENYNGFIFTGEPGWVHHKNTIELITSKAFIEAVARGLWSIRQDRLSPHYEYEDVRGGYIREVTIGQAIAIRDGKFSEFISLLGIEG